MTDQGRPVRIALVGAAGVMGTRLLVEADRMRSVEIVTGVYRPDKGRDVSLSDALALYPFDKRVMAERRVLDASREEVQRFSEETGVSFESAEDYAFEGDCDVVLDVTRRGLCSASEWAERFSGPVIMQEGAAGKGQIITMPVIPETEGNIYRHGGCIHSGVVPIIHQLGVLVLDVRLIVTMQATQTISQPPRAGRLEAVSFEMPDRPKKELMELFPDSEWHVPAITHVAGIPVYAVQLHMILKGKLDWEQIFAVLTGAPFVGIVPKEVTEDTYPLVMGMNLGLNIPPILVYSGMSDVRFEGENTKVKLAMSLNSRRVAVLPNLAAALALGRELSPLDAMRRIERSFGFKP